MRHIMLLALVALALLVSSPSTMANAQDQNPRTATAPIQNIELSGSEPIPPDMADEFVYGVGGGGGGADAQPQAKWLITPGLLAPGGWFVVCGYNNAPLVSVTLPSGKKQFLQSRGFYGIKLFFDQSNNGCWQFAVKWQVGVELGMYTVNVSGDGGQLTHNWGVDYPYCPSVISITKSPTQVQSFFTGFEPDAVLILNIYQRQDDSFHYVATRQVTTDNDGNLLVNVTASRSAGFDFGRPSPYDGEQPHYNMDHPSPLGFIILNAQKELLHYSIRDNQSMFIGYSSGFISPNLQAQIPLVGTQSLFHPLKADNPLSEPFWTWYYFGTDSCEANYAGESAGAETVPYNNRTVTVYKTFNDKTQTIGTLEPGTAVEIVERQDGMTDGRIHVWHHVRTEDGIDGWTYGPNYIPIRFEISVGSIAQVIEANVPLLKLPHDGAERIGDLNVGDHVIVIRQKSFSSMVARGVVTAQLTFTWGFVQTQDGKRGWVNMGGGSVYVDTTVPSPFAALPWKPVAITDEMNAAAGPTDVPTSTPRPSPTPTITPTFAPSATSTPAWVCSSSLSTRLTVGGIGKVSPGKANRVRSEPNGDPIGKVAVGGEFTVLDGPCATNDKTVWWKIDHQGLIGWMAEGKDSEYWVEQGN